MCRFPQNNFANVFITILSEFIFIFLQNLITANMHSLKYSTIKDNN